jgi:hypothetical protein
MADSDARIDDQTRQEDERDARASHEADRMPTPEEERAAERAGKPSGDAARNYEEAAKRGANVKGEGQID